jgi:hypothetical protein
MGSSALLETPEPGVSSKIRSHSRPPPSPHSGGIPVMARTVTPRIIPDPKQELEGLGP